MVVPDYDGAQDIKDLGLEKKMAKVPVGKEMGNDGVFKSFEGDGANIIGIELVYFPSRINLNDFI